MENAILVLSVLCLLLFALLVRAQRQADRARNDLDAERSRQRSISTVYGRITEQWFPLMDRYPYDSQGFRFLGTPVDGVQFEEDRIVFCEFKTNQSSLSPVQQRIKRLVQGGKVYWEEFNFVPDRD